MKLFGDALTTAIDNFGVYANYADLKNAAEMLCIKPQVEDGEDLSEGKITEYEFNTLVEYYKYLQDSKGVNIPYFLEARDMYNQMITNLKDLNHYYNKIISKRYK